MPRTPRKKENKKPVIIEDVKEPEPEPEQEEQETETEQAPQQDEDEYIELVMPKKRPKQRTEKQLEQLKQAREKALFNKEAKRKLKEEAEELVKRELGSKIQAESNRGKDCKESTIN